MKKPYKIFQEVLLECASNYSPKTYVLAKALTALTESELDHISTDDEISDKFMSQVSEPHVEVYRQTTTSGVSPYDKALTACVNSKECINNFEKNRILCKFWDENMPSEEDDYSNRYPSKCLTAVVVLKKKNPDMSDNFSALNDCVGKSIDRFKSFDLNGMPKTEFKESVKYSSYDDIEKERNQISFNLLNNYMESKLDDSTMDAYNRTIFYLPFIESFSEKTDSVMRSDMCKNKNYVSACIATATYEAVNDNVISPIQGATILKNINDISLNEFAVGNMMPIVGLSETHASKIDKTPEEKIAKQTKKPYTNVEEIICKESVKEFSKYVKNLFTEGYIKTDYSDHLTQLLNEGVSDPVLEEAGTVSNVKEFPNMEYDTYNEAVLNIGFRLVGNGVENGSELANIFESAYGVRFNEMQRFYIEAAEERTNSAFVSEVRKLWNKLFKWMDFDGKNSDDEFKKALGELKSNITFSFKDKSDAAIGAIRKAISSQGFTPVDEHSQDDTEKYTGGIKITCRFLPAKGRLFIKYTKNAVKPINESMDGDEASVIRKSILDTALKVFEDNGIKPKNTDSEMKKWTNGLSTEFRGKLCFSGLGKSNSLIKKCCSEINSQIKGKGAATAKISPDNYGTAFLEVDFGTEITEAADMDEDMRDPVSKLNEKGYKVKYSCAGHENTKVKEDRNKDLVKNGKLYSTARIQFEGKVNFGKLPERWERKDTKDGCTALYVKPYTYNEKQGTPSEAYDKWKEAYMLSLNEWIKDLPNKDTSSEEKEVEESVSAESLFNKYYYSSL